MNITLPEELEGQISPEEAARQLALELFADDRVTLGQAASIARVSQTVFLHELGKRKIPVHYGLEDLEHDIAAAKDISHRGDQR